MREKLLELLEYSWHCNKEIIICISNNISKVDDKTIRLINHTLNAHQIWISRIRNRKTLNVWQINPLEDLLEMNLRNFDESKYILENFDLQTTIEYVNSKDDKFENTIFDILFHIINHSTYHRGQINSLFRQNSIEPILTDYIFYKR